MDGFPTKHEHFCGSFGTLILSHSQIDAEIDIPIDTLINIEMDTEIDIQIDSR